MAHSAQEPLDPNITQIYQVFAGEFADKYLESYLLPQLLKSTKETAEDLDDWVAILDEPTPSLRMFYGSYAYSRRGKDRDAFSRITLKALDALLENKPIEHLLEGPDGTAIWDAFVNQCEQSGIKPSEDHNRGIVQGILELSQEIFRIDGIGSIAGWIADGIEKTGHLEPQFNRIVDIRGVGPKSASTFLRDIVLIYNLEQKVAPVDRIHFQTIDRWARAIAPFCVPEPQDDRMADWIVAGKINKYARRARVSGIRFNLGLTYFGQRIVREPEMFPREIKKLIPSLR